jgi:nucleoside-diphosphate-sugar epimerase
LISASSREVYGQAKKFPVHEDSEKRPMNVYARSKAEGERIVEGARENGLVANICRFANVYGSAKDHSDRVVPAFAHAAAFGGVIRVEGPSNAFDFTFVDDVADGLERLVMATSEGRCLPPIHFVSGSSAGLGDLADLARTRAQAPVSVQIGEPRSFDVSSFVGDPGRARDLLGWRSSTSLVAGFQKLLERQLMAKASSI